MLRILLALAVLGSAFFLAPDHSSTALAQCALSAGTVVQLVGTPHLFVADDQGVLHWGGDTRALAGHVVDWNNRCDAGLDILRSARRGDPWLSAGLPKIGEPIYLAKWEDAEAAPTLLHIQTIADVELFGINAANYQTFVIDRVVWQQRYGFDVGALQLGPLASAASFAWTGPERNAYSQLLLNVKGIESATVFRQYQSGGDAAVVLSPIADCERQGLGEFDRTKNAGVALGLIQDCIARLTPGRPTPPIAPPVPMPPIPVLPPTPFPTQARTPSNLRVTALSSTLLRLNWDDTPDELGYRIYGGDQTTPPSTLIAAVPQNVTAYDAPGRVPGTTYCYWVSAFNAGGDSGPAGPVCGSPSVLAGQPAAPSFLRLTGATAATARLEWTDNAGNEDGFRILRNGQTIGTVGPNTSAFTDPSSASAGPSVCYLVIAFSSAGDTPGDQLCPGSTTLVAPVLPTRLHIIQLLDGTGFRLDWIDNATNEDGYRVTRRGQLITTLGANITTYVDASPDPGQLNCYIVSVFNSAGESPAPQICPGDSIFP